MTNTSPLAHPIATSGGANVISVSGGKDSTAMLLLAIERGFEPIAVFADTGHESPLTIDYLGYLSQRLGITIRTVRADFAERIAAKRRFIAADVRTGRRYRTESTPTGAMVDGQPEMRQRKVGGGQRVRWTNKAKRRALEALVPTGIPFLDLCLWKGRFPSTKGRFCTQELKSLVMDTQVMIPLLQAGRDVWSWQGVRADESRHRSSLPELEYCDPGLTVYRPILQWSVQDVFDMHRRHGVEPNPLYREGMGRVGCFPCIMCRKGELQRIAGRFPEAIHAVEAMESRVMAASKRGAATFFAGSNAKHPSGSLAGMAPRDIVAIANIRQAVEWSKTAHGGMQFEMFPEGNEQGSCSSVYGLCE